jgi:hypothetical protein
VRCTAILVLGSLALAGCANGDDRDPTGVFVAARLGRELQVRRATSDEERLVRVEYTLVGTFCARTEAGRDAAAAPDGSARAYVRIDRAAEAQGLGDTVSLRVVDRDGQRRRTYRRWASVGGFAWSPDARQIAISADGRIWVVKPYRPGRRRVTQPGYEYVDICPVWIDGRTIAFYRAHSAALP